MRRAVSLLVVLFTLAAIVGCAGMSPQRVAYNTLDDVAVAVNQGMQAFNERYQAGLQTEAQRTQVLAAYATYQKGMAVAISVSKDATQKQNAVTIATDAAAPLLELIAQLTPKKAEGFAGVMYVYA
jgi:hypothetical protein